MSLRASSSRSAKAVSRRISTPAISQLPCTCYAQTRQASVTQNARSSLVSRRWQSTASYATAATPANDFENHDIVIVGGGLVGLALANAMAASKTVQRAGYKVSLLEASDLEKIRNWSLPEGKWSNRISSISKDSQAFLSSSGGWQRLDETRTRPCEEMSVWDGLSGSRIEFDSWDAQPSATSQPEMAKFVENLHLQRALLQNLHSLPSSNLEIIDKTKVSDIVGGDVKTEGGWPIVHLENGRKLRARLLVGADGFNSPVKKYSEINTMGWNYDTHCLVGTLELHGHPLDKNTTAWQKFLPVGPLGFLPIADNYASLAWSTKPAIAAALKKLDNETLTALINASFRLPWESLSFLYDRLLHSPQTLLQDIAWRSSPACTNPSTLPQEHSEVPPLVKCVHLETCASFPLKMSHADTYLGESELGGLPKRTVLIGDAAHTVHPMAGQGLNMGIGDAASLAKTIESAIAEGADIGSKHALLPYPRERYLTNHNIMNFIDKLHKLYAMESKPVVWARSTGVEILNELPSLKGAMMGTAGANEDPHGGAAGLLRNAGRGGWGTVASAVEFAGGARGLGGALLGGLRQKLGNAIIGGK